MVNLTISNSIDEGKGINCLTVCEKLNLTTHSWKNFIWCAQRQNIGKPSKKNSFGVRN